MSEYTVTIIGKEQLIANLRRISENVRSQAALEAVTAGGKQIEDQARINAPVKTGALRNSASTISQNVQNGAEAVIGFRGLPYARIQEFGGQAGRNHSVTIRGKHYLGRAIDETQGTVVDAMSAVISDYLGRV